MTVGVHTADTLEPAQGGTCVTNCGTGYFSSVALGATWAHYQVLFDDMARIGNAGPALDESRLMGLQFLLQDDFDVWLDDVAFTLK
jgi:hypothetical protein